MKIKVNKHKLNIYYRGSPWGSRTQQHANCLRYAHFLQSESHLGKKQRQAKIAIGFLVGQFHFNTFTSYALFCGGHLVMRSKRCAVQNQGITLKVTDRKFWFLWQTLWLTPLQKYQFFRQFELFVFIVQKSICSD